MSRRGGFSESVKNFIRNREGKATGGHVHHKAPRARALEEGVDPNLVKAPINAELLGEREHIDRHKPNGENERVATKAIERLKSLQPRLFSDEN